MTVTPRSIAMRAAVIGLVLAGLAWLLVGPWLALGLAVSAGAVLVNLGVWVVGMRRVFHAVQAGRSGTGATILIATKMVGLGLLTWGLVQVFPVTAVLLGGSVVVLSILLHAAQLTVVELVHAREA